MQRDPLIARETQVRPAETRETYDSGTGLYDYPRAGASGDDELPIVFLDTQALTDRSEYPKCTAKSPVGWLPPLTRVEVAYDGRKWRIIQAPIMLHGRTTEQIPSADWGTVGDYADACQELTLGSGTVHVFTESAAGVLVPQKYADDSAVEMTAYNTMELVDSNKGVSLVRDRHNRWILTIDPCTLACSET
jgi:hypothetical protein